VGIILEVLTVRSATCVTLASYSPNRIAFAAELNPQSPRFEFNFRPTSRDLFGLGSQYILDSPLDRGRRVRYLTLALAFFRGKVGDKLRPVGGHRARFAQDRSSPSRDHSRQPKERRRLQ
jgi:hypothetical protein